MGFEMFKCIICETEFKADLYDDMGVNKCPKCGQVYNYDEGLVIELTKEQLTRLCAQGDKMNPKDFGAVKDTVVVYADGIHDDTDAVELIMKGLAIGILPNGRLLSESGGTLLVTRIDLTNN